MSTTSDIYGFLVQFLIQNNWEDEYTQKQARALWTSYCLIAGLDADTAMYDNDLQILFNKAALDELITYEEFDGYMCELIV